MISNSLCHKFDADLTLADREYVVRYCWLVNTTGKPDGFLPIDLLQEHNVRDIKVCTPPIQSQKTKSSAFHYTFAVTGPYAEWDYIGKISASIPCQRKVKDHVERHTAPDKEEDVARLQASYNLSQIHTKKVGRRLHKRDKAADFIALGSEGTRLRKPWRDGFGIASQSGPQRRIGTSIDSHLSIDTRAFPMCYCRTLF